MWSTGAVHMACTVTLPSADSARRSMVDLPASVFTKSRPSPAGTGTALAPPMGSALPPCA